MPCARCSMNGDALHPLQVAAVLYLVARQARLPVMVADVACAAQAPLKMVVRQYRCGVLWLRTMTVLWLKCHDNVMVEAPWQLRVWYS